MKRRKPLSARKLLPDEKMPPAKKKSNRPSIPRPPPAFKRSLEEVGDQGDEAEWGGDLKRREWEEHEEDGDWIMH